MKFNKRPNLAKELARLSKWTNLIQREANRPRDRKTSTSNYNSEHYAKIGMLMDNARNRVEDLFAALDVKTTRQGRRYVGRCPVHGGRSYDSFNFYPDGYKGAAFWNCLSRHCERHFKGNVMGLVRGVLSNQRLGWCGPGDEEVPWQNALSWMCEFLDMPWESIKPDLSLAERNRFIAGVEILTLSNQTYIQKGICSRARLRSFLEIPAQFYIDRGFSPETLDRYDVGFCQHPESDLYGRVVVPVYDDDAQYVIGCIGRSTHAECPKCCTFHHVNAECYVQGNSMKEFAKVKMSHRFNDKNHLYNMWFAKNHILRTRCVVVVEGCADVWKLEESGVTNAVAINGSDLSEPQQIALECSGATQIVCLTDNDEAGENAYEQITRRCWFAKVTRPAYDGKDIGDMDMFTLKQHQFHKELKDRLD